MTKIFGIIAVSVLLMTTSGCFVPVNITYTEPIQGQVIDRKTGFAVSNANIHLTAVHGRGKMDVTTSSDKNGEFNIPKQSEVVWIFFLGDPFIMPPRFEIQADGYKIIDSYIYEKSRNLYVESEPGNISDTNPLRIRIELESVDPETP